MYVYNIFHKIIIRIIAQHLRGLTAAVSFLFFQSVNEKEGECVCVVCVRVLSYLFLCTFSFAMAMMITSYFFWYSYMHTVSKYLHSISKYIPSFTFITLSTSRRIRIAKTQPEREIGSCFLSFRSPSILVMNLFQNLVRTCVSPFPL